MRKVKRPTDVLAEGIYADPHGITILFRPKGSEKPIRERWPLVDANGIAYSKRHNSELVIRRMQLLEDYRTGRIGGERGAPGTLAFAIAAFLEKHPVIKGDESQKNADYHNVLKHWTESPLGAMPVLAIRRRLVADVLNAWTNAGRAPSTVNSRKRALGDVLRVELEKEQLKRRAKGQDDDDVIVPTDLIPDVPPKELEARGIDIDFVLMILAAMPDRGRAEKGGKRAPISLTKIRIGIILWTGLSHKSLIRLRREDVNFAKELIRLPARKKGKGAAAVWVEALPQAFVWLRQYDAAKLWGQTFSRSSMHKAFTGARDRVRAKLKAAAEASDATDAQRAVWEHFQATVPLNFHPYDCRHSFLTETLARTGDRTGTMQLGNLKTEKMLNRYTKGAVPKRVASAMAIMRAHWAPETLPKADVLRLVPKTGA